MLKPIQNKYNYYMRKMKNYFNKPETQFLKESVLGIMKSKSVILRRIAMELQEEIPLKKTCKRLRNHLQKEGMWRRLTKEHNKNIKHKIGKNDYAVLDISDIQKEYAQKMEGLDKVRDGDNDNIGTGYWMMNILRISKNGQEMTPLYNKVYSFEKGTISENTEILSAFKTVAKNTDKDLVKVIDRGGDRKTLIVPFLRNNNKFIIRLNGGGKARHLQYQSKSLSVPEISKRVDQKFKLIGKVKKNGKTKNKYFKGGAVKVKFKDFDYNHTYQQELWFVSIKRLNGGYSYFLLNIDENDPEKVVNKCFKAYGFRWHIEEYHRHLKTQYDLESIQLMNFNSIQTMVTLLMISMYFIYTEMGKISWYILSNGPLKFDMGKNKYSLDKKFVYYMIGKQIAKILSEVTVKKLNIYQKKLQRKNRQLKLEFEF